MGAPAPALTHIRIKKNESKEQIMYGAENKTGPAIDLCQSPSEEESRYGLGDNLLTQPRPGTFIYGLISFLLTSPYGCGMVTIVRRGQPYRGTTPPLWSLQRVDNKGCGREVIASCLTGD